METIQIDSNTTQLQILHDITNICRDFMSKETNFIKLKDDQMKLLMFLQLASQEEKDIIYKKLDHGTRQLALQLRARVLTQFGHKISEELGLYIIDACENFGGVTCMAMLLGVSINDMNVIKGDTVSLHDFIMNSEFFSKSLPDHKTLAPLWRAQKIVMHSEIATGFTTKSDNLFDLLLY